jgi:CubicO group peptidase (beta-lactamase class C family)
MATSEPTAGQELLRVLQEGVEARVFPGAVTALGQLTQGRVIRAEACAGVLEPDGAAVGCDTLYDLASLTKPVVAAAALRLSQRGQVDLHAPAAVWLPELAETTGGDASLALLLSHRAGLTPWAALYEEIVGPAGSASARATVLRAAASRRDPGAAPDPALAASVYSDLGYIVAGEALARAAGCGLDALLRREVCEPLGIAHELFYAASFSESARGAWLSRVAPTEQCALRGRLSRAEVHDENCAAFGGICGHAGLFGSARGLLEFGLALLDALAGRSDWLDQALLRWALSPRPGGGHVLGWDTRSGQGSSAGTLFSARSFGHLGFTGTSIWCDPVRNLCAVLLSNRVHPTRENIAIREFRPRFHDAVARLSLA